MTASEPPAPPQEAVLIRTAREAMGISPEAAAKRTPVRIQGSRWRHIERGWERTRPALKLAVAPAKTLAHMAHTVGLSPERLTEAGRPDAAAVLDEILRREAERVERPPVPDLDDRHEAFVWTVPGFTIEQRRMLLELVRDIRRAQRDGSGQDEGRDAG